jgi:hypothetical protein
MSGSRRSYITVCTRIWVLAPQRWQLKTSECHSKRVGGTDWPIRIRCLPSPPPLKYHWHGIRGLKLSPDCTLCTVYIFSFSYRSVQRYNKWEWRKNWELKWQLLVSGVQFPLYEFPALSKKPTSVLYILVLEREGVREQSAIRYLK